MHVSFGDVVRMLRHTVSLCWASFVEALFFGPVLLHQLSGLTIPFNVANELSAAVSMKSLRY